MLTRLLLAAIVTATAASRLRADALAIGERDAQQWVRHLLPLPHEITVHSAVSLPRVQVAVRVRPGATEMEQQAASDLRRLLGGVPPTGRKRFEIVVGVLDGRGRISGRRVPDAARLQGLSNREQAYLIRPQGKDQLLAAALDPRGVFYASRTLLQLLGARLTSEEVVIPLAVVTDWPDLEERGLWNFPLDLIPWLADLKLNFAKIPTEMETLERGKPVSVKPLDQGRVQDARRRAFNPVFTSTHLNFLHRHGLNAAYPELVGKGERAKCPYKYKIDGATAPCASNPLLEEIIAGWLRAVGRQGAQEVSVWLTEFYAQCECEACLRGGQFQLETKAALAAFEEVRKGFPALRLRVFFTLRTPPEELKASTECLAMLPPDVKAEIVYGTSEPYVKAAASGRWVGDYAAPYLTKGGYTGLVTYPSWMRTFLERTSERRFRGAYAISYLYTSSDYHRAIYSQQISALAEWSWNLKGRDVGDVACAWATRQGLARPESVADWVTLMDPLEHDLVGSAQSLFGEGLWTRAADRIGARQALRPGEDLLWAFRNPEGFDERLGRCRQALETARGLPNRSLELESEYALTLVEAMRTLARLSTTLAAPDLDEPGKDEARKALAVFEGQVERLVSLMDEQTDRLQCEPKAFAQQMKEEHRERWQQRLLAIRAAVGQALQ